MSDEQSEFDEAVRRSLFLGEQAIAVLMASEGVDRETAMTILRRQKQNGRRRSAAMAEDREASREQG